MKVYSVVQEYKDVHIGGRTSMELFASETAANQRKQELDENLKASGWDEYEHVVVQTVEVK
jgi:hypothetical protein